MSQQAAWASPLWQIAVESAERTTDAWKTLEPADSLPKDLRESTDKQIHGVATTMK
jgi:hypothetical protein